jgi:type VII secretion integral membrane protein EccD
MTPQPRTGRLTRVTLSGGRRRADLVLPSDEPLGLFVPELAAMVGPGAGSAPGGYQLTTLDGTVLDLGATLAQAGVSDGTLLRLDLVSEAPPAPILHDVADHVSDDADGLRGRWDAAALRWTATAVAVAGILVAALVVTPYAGAVGVLVTGVLAAAAGAATTPGSRAAGVAVLLAGTAVALVGVANTALAVPERIALGALVLAGAVGALGLVTGHSRAGLMGAGALALQLGLWWGLPLAGLPAADTGAVLAVIGIGLLGLLPRLAVAASGLAGLDDRQTADEPVTRVAADAAVDAAHRGLALACVATAASTGLAGAVLAGAGGGWAIALACLTAVAVLLRMRAYPLTMEVVALLAAALAIGYTLLRRWIAVDPQAWWAAALSALAVAVIGLVLLSVTPRPHVRARARQLGDRLEGVVIVASVPVAVGVFGVYERLLQTF